MRQKKGKRIFSMLLTLCLVLCMVPMAAFAAEDEAVGFTDMPNNWSTAALEKAIDNGLLSGYQEGGEKFIKASNFLTRAEMAAVINRAFAADKTADLSKVGDVSATAWYAKDMAKAVNMRTFAYDTKMRPEDKITRQEAFTVLARAFKLVSSDSSHKALNAFFDKVDIANWALDSLNGMAEVGYIQGSEDKMNPKGNITRAEFAVVMDNLVKQYIVSPGEVTEVVTKGNVLVRSSNVTLRNVTINGDLIIADGVGEGDVTLDGVTVTGRTVVRGGGQNSIIIKGNSSLGKVVVARVDGKVRVAVEGGANVEVIYVDDGSDDVIVGGKFSELEVAGDGVTAYAQNANIDKAEVSGDNSKIVIADGSRFKDGSITGKSSAIVADEGSILGKVTVSGPDASISGKGEVKEVEVKKGGDGATIDTPNSKIKVDESVNGTKAAGGTTVEGGQTATNNAAGNGATVADTPATPPSTGGGGGGTTTVVVSAINIIGDAMVGATLTAEPNTELVTYQWLRADTKNGTDTEISGATNKTYILDDVDMDKYIKVKVTGISGKATGDMTSGSIGPVELASATISDPNGTFYNNDEEDITATITWNSAREITKIIGGGAELTKNTHYTVDGNTLTIKKEFLTGLNVRDGSSGFAFEFDRGSEVTGFMIRIKTKYTVTFDVNGGSGDMGSDTVISGENYTFPANEFTAPAGQVFDIWKVYNKEEGEERFYAEGATIDEFLTGHVEDDGETIVVYAVWKDIPKYTVTFVSYDDTVLDTQTVEHGSDATAPADPIRDGYIFTGWDTDFSNVTSNLTVKAQWEAEVLGTISPTVIAGDGKVLLTAITETGYTFYYKTTSSTDEQNKPTVNSEDLAGWHEFTADTNITASNDVEIFVQVVKVTDGKIKAWGEASATPKADITEVGFESLTANGTSGETTTTVLYVGFDKEIPSLSPENITVEGATLKLLTMSSTSNECSITIEDIEVKNGENVKVTINKEGYLFTPTSKEVEVYVANVQAEINPASADFDKQNPENVETTINFGTATKIESIKKGDTALTKGTDYTVSSNTLTIKKEYLLAQPVGTTKLEIAFDQGYAREFSISIKNEGIYSIVVEEITGGFGGETATASKNSTEIEEAKEGDLITISIAYPTGTYNAWKIKSAKFKDDNGNETDLNTSSKIIHSFTMPASNVTVIIELEPEADSEAPTISNSGITAERITDISLTLDWEEPTDNLTPNGYLKYYVYQSEEDNIGTVTNAEDNGTLLNLGGTYVLRNLKVKDLDPDKTYYFNVVVADYAGNKTAYNTIEVKTLMAITDDDLTSKVTRPVKYETINNVFASGDQYKSTNTIIWWKIEGDTKEQVYGKFEPNTIYQAEVTLQAEEGYSFNDSTLFTYTDVADVSFKAKNNDPGRGDLIITFPATEAVTKYSLTLEGGNITSSPSESQIAENTEVTVTVNPNDGEQLVSFTVNGVEEKQSLVNNQYTFTIKENTTIKVTYSDEYDLTSSGDDVVEFKVNGISVTTAKKGDPVTMLVTPTEGEELIGAVLQGIDKEDVDEIEVGKEYSFIMPDNDVDAKITVGEPDKELSINPGKIGGGYITLLNGKLKWSNETTIEGLTWSYFINTLTMHDFTANYLGSIAGEKAFQFDLELIGASTINSAYMAALNFSETVNIRGDGNLYISNIYAYDYVVEGIGLRSTMNKINLKDQSSIHVMVENTKKQNGVAISNVMPFIGNGKVAYKGTAVWSAGDGDSAEKPIEITYHVEKDTVLKGNNIQAGNNAQIEELWSDSFNGTPINSDDTISFTDGIATVYAKYKDKFYKIIIKRDTPIEDFALDQGSVTDYSAKFAWTEAKDATSLKIVQSADGGNTWTDSVVQGGAMEPTSTSATVTGLAADTGYQFKLVVEGGDNRGDSNIVEVTTGEEPPEQTAVNAEADKYESTAEIDKEVEAGVDVTDTVIKLVDEATADENIALSYSVTPGNYLEVVGGVIKLKAQKITEGDAIENVTITFTKGDRTATKQVTVTIKSSNKKMIKIGGIEYDLNGDALPDGLSWDEGTKTLAMNGYAGGAIYTNFLAGYELKNLEINGENTITVNDETSTSSIIGLGTNTALTISGNGTLMINVKTLKSSNTIGLYSGFYSEDDGRDVGSFNTSTITVNGSLSINIDVDASSGHSYAMRATTLNLKGAVLNIASKSGNRNAYGIDVINYYYTSGSVNIADGGIVAGINSNPVFSRETPYVINKASKITNLTWNSENNATEENKAVEYTIHLRENTAELNVEDLKTVLSSSITLSVYSDSDFSTEWESVNFDEGKTSDTIYVKAERTVSNNTTTRYFKINLIKETVEP
ncbi:MAG: X2-like carbohydrate binding domain-containing protein [Anaerovoracaceae bacterium]|jgi:hypothetical protein